MSELLFEIGCEELPASYARGALDALPAIVAKALTERGLPVEEKSIRVAGTARRLAVGIASLVEQTPRTKRTAKGPPKSAAYKDGKPTKAAESFAQKNGVALDKLTTVKDEKGGEYIAVELEEGGRATADVLAEALPKVIEAIPFPKVMRWASMEFKFARPVRWLLASFGGKAVPFSWGGCTAGLSSRGHRFLAPDPFTAKTWAEYESGLEKASVIVDPAKRKAATRDAANQAARSAGGEIEADEALLEVVSFLVEKPHPVMGSFDKALLALPREVIVTPMKVHQKYFPVIDSKKALQANFVTISNVPPRDPKVVARGNERVLRARLADAQFFFGEDLKVSLTEMAKGLSGVTFQAKLGTYAEKIQRMSNVATRIREELGEQGVAGLPALTEVDQAVAFCKADLKSKMVFEFPELQGLMGRSYARKAAGTLPGVADAIAEHYQPRFAGDVIPSSALGAIVSLADRIDTLVGVFCTGERPTGSADPYGLRRHAVAILHILRGKGWSLPLRETLSAAAADYGAKFTPAVAAKATADAIEFIKARLENALKDEGVAYDAVDAALAARFDDVGDAVARAKAVAELKKKPEFETIAIAFKRAANILSGPDAAPFKGSPLDSKAFVHDAERALHAAVTRVAEKVTAHKKARRFTEALVETLALKDPIDAFFTTGTGVMVMDKDEKLKRNRLAILSEVVDLFSDTADFTKVVVSA